MTGQGSHQFKPYALRDGLATYRLGQGDPILMMPGPHRFQQPGVGAGDLLIQGLLDLGRQVITFDPPGSGYSDRPEQVSMAEMIGCASEALDLCGLRGPVAIFGHSMAGLVSVAFALAEPGRAERLVLVGTGAGATKLIQTPGALWHRGHPGFWKMALLGMLMLIWPCFATEKLSSNIIQRHSYQDQRWAASVPVALRDWFRPRKGRGGDWFRVARKLDYASRLGEIEVPALILCGRHDPQFPMAFSLELATGIKAAKLVTFEDSGHYPFDEEPERFWAEIGAFLEQPGPFLAEEMHARDE